MNNYYLFFELLQVAIGIRQTLSRVPTANEWGMLFMTSQKQALVGVCFVGVQKLLRDDNTRRLRQSNAECSAEELPYKQYTQNLPKALRLKWLSLSFNIQTRNKELTETCVSVCKELARDGLKSCVLKGQSNLAYYPDHLKDSRMAGDIDLWCMPADSCGLKIPFDTGEGKGSRIETYYGKEAVIEYALMRARLAGIPKPLVCYHHTDLDGVWKESVEIHHRPTYLWSPFANRNLERFFNMGEKTITHDEQGFPKPSVSFDTVYQLAHIYHHLFDEGIGMRQLMDYYFVLKALHTQQETSADFYGKASTSEEGRTPVRSNEEIIEMLQKLGMRNLAATVMFVLQKIFEPSTSSDEQHLTDDWKKQWPWMICKPDASSGQVLLNEIMRAGNFGKYDNTVVRGKHNAENVWVKFRRNRKFIRFYPKDVLWEPVFRVYYHFWRNKYIKRLR